MSEEHTIISFKIGLRIGLPLTAAVLVLILLSSAFLFGDIGTTQRMIAGVLTLIWIAAIGFTIKVLKSRHLILESSRIGWNNGFSKTIWVENNSIVRLYEGYAGKDNGVLIGQAMVQDNPALLLAGLPFINIAYKDPSKAPSWGFRGLSKAQKQDFQQLNEKHGPLQLLTLYTNYMKKTDAVSLIEYLKAHTKSD